MTLKGTGSWESQGEQVEACDNGDPVWMLLIKGRAGCRIAEMAGLGMKRLRYGSNNKQEDWTCHGLTGRGWDHILGIQER